MSTALDVLLSALQYDAAAHTVTLSPEAPSLAAAWSSLQSAFCSDEVVIDDIELLETPQEARAVTLALTGKALFLGGERPVYLEVTSVDGKLDSLLLLAFLPAKWHPAEGFAGLPDSLSELWAYRATAAVSHGLRGVEGVRNSGNQSIDLSGLDLKNGLQVLFDRLVNAADIHPENSRALAEKAGIPADDLKLWTRVPDRAQIQANRAANWLQVECWWEPEPKNTGSVQETGYAVVYDLDSRSPRSHRWLRRVGAPVSPIVVEAEVIEGFQSRYTARMDRGASLGETAAALDALVPGSVALPDAPAVLSLVEYTCAPGQGLRLTVAAGGQDDHIVSLGPLELRQVRYTIGTSETEMSAATGAASPWCEVEGLVSLFGVVFDVRARPGAFLEGGLADPDSVHLGTLIETALPVTLPFGLDSVTLQRAWVHRALGDAGGATTLELSLEGHVELLANEAIVLDAIDLTIEQDAAGAATGHLRATLTLGPVALQVQASHEDGDWGFSGSGTAPDGIPLIDLVDHLVHACGASVPSEIPDVRLKELAVSYHTGTQTIDIQAGTDWVVDDDVPVLAGSYEAHLDLTVARDRQRGGHDVTAVASWTLTKPITTPGSAAADDVLIDAHTVLSREQQTFGFDLTATDSPLTLDVVAQSLGLDAHIPPLIAGDLNELLQVSALSVDFARPGSHLDLVWTRTVGDGLFLSEYHHDAKATLVEVSWSPSTPDGTLGIGDVVSLLGVDDAFGTIHSALAHVGLDHALDVVKEYLTFHRLGFSWSADGTEDTLTLLAHSASEVVGYSYVYLPRDDRGLIVGLTFEPGKSLADLDFLPDAVQDLIDSTEHFLRIEPTLVQISTLSGGRFIPPTFNDQALLPTFERTDPTGRPGTSPRSPFGTNASRIAEGLTLGARVVLGDDETIRRVVDFDHLDAQVVISESNAAVQAVLPGSLRLDAGGGNTLVLADAMLKVEMDHGLPTLDVGGSLDLHVFGKLLHAAGWLSLSPESIAAHLELEGFQLPPVPGLRGVNFVASKDYPLYLDVGLQFEPPGLDLGMDGHFFIWVGREVRGSVVFVLEVVEVLPALLYVEFKIAELDLPVLLEAMTGVQYALHLAEEAARDATALDGDAGAAAGDADVTIRTIQGVIQHVQSILDEVRFDEVRLRWADSIVNLPDGTTTLPGVGFRGGLTLFGWHAYAALDFSTGPLPSLTGLFEAESLDIHDGLVRVWGDGPGVRRKTEGNSVDLIPVTDGQAPADSADWYIPPGGPVLILSTQAAPFLHADLHADLFGVFHADVHADITDEGFIFDLHTATGTSPTNHAVVDLECHYWREEHRLEAHGDLSLRLHGRLGPLIPHVSATAFDLDVALDAHVSIVVDADAFHCSLRGSFDYHGTTLHVPELTLTEPFKKVEDLIDSVWNHIEALAHTIFEEILAPVGKFVAEAAEKMASVATEAARETAHIATESAHEAAHIATEAAATVDKVATEIAHMADAVGKEAEDVLAASAARAEAAAKPLHDQADALRNEKGSVLAVATHHAEALLLDAEGYAETADLFVADVTARASHAAEALARDAAAWVAGRLRMAAQYAAATAAAAAQAVADIEQDIEALTDEISDLGRKLDDLARATVDTIRSGYHTLTGWL